MSGQCRRIQGFRGLYHHVQRFVVLFRHIIYSFYVISNCSKVDVNMFGDFVVLSIVLFTPCVAAFNFLFLNGLIVANNHS